jgi:hypothetical protein
MRTNQSRTAFLAVLIVALLSGSGRGADLGRTVKSAVFPGMGQLGDGQKLKGLLFMAGEVVLLSMTVDQFTKSRTYAFETDRLRIEYGFGGTYSQIQSIHSRWNSYYDKAEKARINTALFLGLAGACWGLNIADAILFAPVKQEEDVSLLQETLSKVSLGFAGTSGQVKVSTEF